MTALWLDRPEEIELPEPDPFDKYDHDEAEDFAARFAQPLRPSKEASVSDFCHVLRIEPHPANVREDLGDLTELADSIREQGILQPIVVQPRPGRPGSYLILAGHRRYAAARLIGLDEVPIVVREAAGHASTPCGDGSAGSRAASAGRP